MAVFFPSIPVKYNSGTTLNNSISQNKISFGINDVNYGPSSQTGWHANVTDNLGNPYPFTIISDTYSLGYVANEADALPTFWGTTGSTNNDLLSMINGLDERIGQPAFSGLSEAITWIEGTQKYTIQNRFYENITTTNLRRCYDAGFTASYPLVNNSWYDISGNDSTATMNNTVFDTDSGGVFEFNGTNANVPIGQPLENNTSYSINTWIFSTSNVGARNICSTQDSPFWVSNGVLYGGVGGDFTVTSYTSIPLNEWVNVSLTFDDASGTMNLYVNGTLVDTNTTSSHFTKQNMYIGSHFSGGIAVSFFEGFIGHVSLYDGVISDTDVIQNYNVLAPRFSVSPLPTPTPTVTSTQTPTNTTTQTPTQTPTTTTTLTATPTQTPTNTLTPTNTFTPTPSTTTTLTATPTQTPTNTSTTTRTPTPTPTPGLLKVLFLGDGSVTSIASLINTYITSTGQSISYSAVTMSTNYTGSGNITKANYDVVMIYTNSGQIGTTTMANALTTFVGQGGSVVSGTFLWNLYPVGYNFTGTTAFNINGQSNPVGGNIIITSATTITNGIGLTMPTTFNNGAITLNSGSSQLATYSDGTNLLALKTIGSSTIISINACPLNISNSTSTITKMFGNAILYAGGKLNPAPTPTPTTTQTPTNTPNLQGFNYPNFASTAGTVAVGNATVTSNIYYLTTATGGQVGNVYRTTAIQYNRNFSTTWSTFIGGGTGADGYCVQWTPTNNTNGPTGGGVGLLNTAINAITFLTFTNNNYTWYKNGVSQGATSVTSGFWRQTLYFWGDYNHSAQTFALYYSTTNSKPGSPNQTFNSFSFDTGSYYMGFGAGTGGSNDNQEILSWNLQFT